MLGATHERPRLIAVSTVPPLQPETGFSLRVTNVLRELGDRWSITLVVPSLPAGQQYPSPMEGVDRIETVPMGGEHTYHPTQFDVAPLNQRMDALLREQEPQAVLLWHGSEFLAFGREDYPFVLVDRIDCATLTSWRAARFAPTLRQRISELLDILTHAPYEWRLGRTANRVTVVGESDARAMRCLSGRNNVEIVSNGVSLPDDQLHFGGEDPEPTIVFTGVLSYPPNEDAASFFAREVHPLVRKQVPSALFVIAGRGPSAIVQDLGTLPGVRIEGDVDDMRRVLAGSWVAVAPMRSGSGVKNKVLEAWAMSRPAVMTSHGANGLSLDAIARELIADRPAKMAQLLVGLLQEPARRRAYGEAGRALVLEHHSWKEVGLRFDALLRRGLKRAG